MIEHTQEQIENIEERKLKLKESVEKVCHEIYSDSKDWTYDNDMERLLSKAALCAKDLMALEEATDCTAYVCEMPTSRAWDKHYGKGFNVSVLFYNHVKAAGCN